MTKWPTGFAAREWLFSHTTAEVSIGGTLPHYNKIDTAKYAKYAPVTEAEDIECMISALKSDQQFKDCKIILYGVSEGTIIAPMVAERRKVDVDAIFLHGYANENMRDIIEWQNAGYGVMILVNSIFDKDGDGKISREEYESDEDPIKRSKAYFFKTCH